MCVESPCHASPDATSIWQHAGSSISGGAGQHNTCYACLQGVHAMTDAGPQHLARCQRLRHLDISHCWKVTDEGLSHLGLMSTLAHLDIAYCWQVGRPGVGSSIRLCQGSLIVRWLAGSCPSAGTLICWLAGRVLASGVIRRMYVVAM